MIPPRTAADVKRIVQERVQETMVLEFKRQLPDPGKNLDMAKTIAALCNTDGGHIIYGIGEDSDSRASELLPFSLVGCTERISLIAQTLDGPVNPTEVYTIEDSPGEGYAVVAIARSRRAPHFVEGAVYGRTPKTTTALSRRQVGELFARSAGFIDEFHLRTNRPGQVLVEGHRENESSWVSFTNDGETDVTNVEWVERDRSGLIIQILTGWPFPIEKLRPGQRVRQQVLVPLGRGPFTIRTSWNDDTGERRTEDWRITF